MKLYQNIVRNKRQQKHHNNSLQHNNRNILLAFLFAFSLPLKADLLQSSVITAINTELNNTRWAATNLRDDNPATRWLARSRFSNSDIIFQLNNNGDAFCFDSTDLINYGNDDRSVKQFMLLTSNDLGINTDTSTDATGWTPLVADAAPSGLLNYLNWAQGGRLVSIDSQLNTTTWAAKNSHDGNGFSRWLSRSRQSNNILEYSFDTDWDGSTGNGIPIEEIEITNYGNDDRSIKELQVEVTTDGINWFKLEVPGTAANDLEYIYTRQQDGGVLGAVNSQLNTSTWAAANIHDGSQLSRWLSKNTQGNNTIEFTFDPNNSGLTGANGDADDLFNIEKLHLENYGNDDRSIKEFQVAVKTLFNPNWSKIRVPGATIGTAGYDFLSSHHGAELVSIDSQLNTTTWGADNLHDGDHMTRWLSRSRQSNNVLAFQFDVNEDGNKDAADYFTINRFFLQNYGIDDRSIKEFQVSVKTASDTTWQKIKVPGAVIGEENYNFLLKDHGGVLAVIDSELNNSTWAAKNIHDGSQVTRWLSRQSHNTLEFQFDANEDGNTATANDLFTMKSFYLGNYGADDRSIKEFQVAVKTLSQPTWKKLKVPGAVTGVADHNFLLTDNGGILTSVDSQLNTTNWAAKNIHDGSQITRWLSLSRQLSNTLDFQFDVDENGTTGTATDLFTMDKFYLQNYGNDDRSIKEFQIEVKTASNTNWTKVLVPGTAANDPNYNFSLAIHGGALTFIDSQLNTSSWAAKNIHDGNQVSRWLSRPNQVLNTLAFAFDTDNNGSTGDVINLDTITLINYGNDDRSIQTFEIDIQISGGAWQAVNAPGGGTLFTANMDNNGQSWAVTPQTNVTATRIRTLSNYGDPTYTGASEITFSGPSVGPTYTFTAAMNGNGETFTLVNLITDVTDVRLRTISNYGDPNYIGASEFRVLGLSTIETSTFVAAMHGNGETFTLDNNDIPVDVTDVKLITISNYGDPNYVGASEFKVLGPSITETATFIAAMHGNGETFVLDNNDIPVDVTDVKFTTISNYGDPNYVGARDFKVLGDAITETNTFVAAMHGNGEDFVLDNDDVPVGVTDVKLITISNHGDTNYVGAAEFEVIGKSVGAAHTFTLPMQAAPYRIALDNEDTVTGVIGARIITIRNHGDPNYTGAADFQLLGTAIGPSYIFEAAMDTSTQHFSFAPLTSKLLRFHTLNNHGDLNYTGASELVLNTGICPTGDWRMDEESWDGTSGEVIDTSGGGHEGTVFGIGSGLADPNTANSTPAPAIVGTPGTCRYGEFDGVDDYIEIPDSDDLDNTAQLTLSAWFNAKSFTQTNGTNARGLFSKRPSFSSNVSYGAFFWNGHGTKLYIDIDGTNNRFASNTSFNSETWYHIAIVYDGTQPASQRVRLYVDGALDGTFTESSSSIPDTQSNFYIGNLYTGLSQLKVFDGAIDEVNVIPKSLSPTEVLALKNATQPCAVSPVFLDISTTSTSASTCAAHPITIRACADAACNTLISNYDGTIDISVSSGHGDWAVNSANGTLNNAISDDGAASYTFDAALDNSSVILDLNNTHAETVTITVNDDNASAIDISDNIQFSDNAFVIDHGDNFHVAGRDQAMSVSLYTKDNGFCAINPLYTGNTNVKIWLDRDAADPSGTAPSINNIALPDASSTNFTLAFTNGTANFNLASTDVGKYDLNIVDDSLSFSDVNISGETGIVTRPFGFYVTVSGDGIPADGIAPQINAKASNHSGGKFMAAGDNFKVNVRAVAWEALDDIDNNGIPDGHDDFNNNNFDPANNADLSHNAVVSSFGQEQNSQAESVIISAFEFLPTPDVSTNVLEDEIVGIPLCSNCNISSSSFSSGAGSSGSVYYNDVGIIEVTAKLFDNSYLGGANVIGASGFVGRFVPHHFKLNKIVADTFDGELSGGNGFVYTGQMDTSTPAKGAITYGINMEPKFTITAESKYTDTTTNYTGDFMNLLDNGIVRVSPVADALITDSALTANLLIADITEGNGVITYTFNANDNFVYTRNAAAVIDKFSATIDLVIDSVTDQDDVIALDTNGDVLGDPTTAGVLILTPERPVLGLDIYFGRWYLANSYGPETSPLPIHMEIQYWNGSNFVANPLENAQTFDAANLTVTDVNLSPGITHESGSGVFDDGSSSDIILSAPGNGNSGNVKLEYSPPSWLLYDWDNVDTFLDGPYDDKPTATATFGIFRGNDRIISWREVAN